MTNYRLDDIVLIAFPHTDFKTVSKRPALVLFDGGDQDILVARITTQKHQSPVDYEIKQWKRCGLLARSYIRLGKLATLEKRFIEKQLGRLDDSTTDSIRSILQTMFGLQ